MGMDNFLTVYFKLKLIDEEVSALVLCMDRMHAMDMLESLNTPLQTIAVKLQDCLVIRVTRRLPSFVSLDPDLKIDPTSVTSFVAACFILKVVLWVFGCFILQTDIYSGNRCLYTVCFTIDWNTEYRFRIQLSHHSSINQFQY